jgi:hypothetical protein
VIYLASNRRRLMSLSTVWFCMSVVPVGLAQTSDSPSGTQARVSSVALMENGRKWQADDIRGKLADAQRLCRSAACSAAVNDIRSANKRFGSLKGDDRVADIQARIDLIAAVGAFEKAYRSDYPELDAEFKKNQYVEKLDEARTNLERKREEWMPLVVAGSDQSSLDLVAPSGDMMAMMELGCATGCKHPFGYYLCTARCATQAGGFTLLCGALCPAGGPLGVACGIFCVAMVTQFTVDCIGTCQNKYCN